MKFKGLQINIDYSFLKKCDVISGRIDLQSSNMDNIYLKLDEEYCKKILEITLPLFEKAAAEKINLIREEWLSNG